MLIRSNILNQSNVLAADYQNLLGSTCNINNEFIVSSLDYIMVQKKIVLLPYVSFEINGQEYCKSCGKQN